MERIKRLDRQNEVLLTMEKKRKKRWALEVGIVERLR